MAFKLADAFVVVSARTAAFNKSIAGVQSKLGGLVSRVQGMTSVITSQFAIMGAGLGGAFAAAGIVRAAATFEHSMQRVKALTQSSGEEFNKLAQQAKDLGRTTQFSASQAAEAMGFFALAGFKTDKIIAAMPDTLNLAAAGQLEIGAAADIVAKIMSGMGIEAEQLGGTVDILAKAMTTANTDLTMLGEAMKFVGPVGRGAGKSLEELTAIIQVFSNAGIQGGAAGTALRNILLRLQQQPSEVKKAFEGLNVAVEDSEGKMRPIADIVDDLNIAMQDMTDVQREATLGQIAGMRAASAFSALMAQGGNKVREMEKALQGAGGTAKHVAEVQMDSLSGAWIKVKSAMEGAAIEMGTALMPLLKGIVDVIQRVTSRIAGMKEQFETIGFVLSNWGTIWTVAVLNVRRNLLQLVENIRAELLTIVEFGKWFGRNFVDIFRSAFDLIVTIAKNWAGNFNKIYAAIWDRITGKTKKFEWPQLVALTDGFVTKVKELPKVIRPEITDAMRAIDRQIEDTLNKAFAKPKEAPKVDIKEADVAVDAAADVTAAGQIEQATADLPTQIADAIESARPQFMGLAEFAKGIQAAVGPNQDKVQEKQLDVLKQIAENTAQQPEGQLLGA